MRDAHEDGSTREMCEPASPHTRSIRGYFWQAGATNGSSGLVMALVIGWQEVHDSATAPPLSRCEAAQSSQWTRPRRTRRPPRSRPLHLMVDRSRD
jgi:hypothetical protein